MQQQDERDIIARAQARDSEAFGQIYEAYFDRIFRYIGLKTGFGPEAEDLTQQVFLKALESIGSYRVKGDVPFSAWLYRIAHNQVVDHLRKRSRRPTAELDENLPLPAKDDPAGETELKMASQALMAATRHLTTAQQEVIALRFGAELSITEVSRLTGRTEGAVKAMQHAAITSLRKLMVDAL
ncbi:RNA polymerase, sigma-24 subunit, ECF subfamily [Dehalogenimonas lykanthroporepellens BL-DC-9]|nr:RNA polymerase, sigma-24 subunit, ECF subfamily [Dehalogenimonas lykanthroporepellens BL-DC-9]